MTSRVFARNGTKAGPTTGSNSRQALTPLIQGNGIKFSRVG
jgi:hypothetical protein